MIGKSVSSIFKTIVILIILLQFYIIYHVVKESKECFENASSFSMSNNNTHKKTKMEFQEEQIQHLKTQIQALSLQLEIGKEPAMIYEKKRRRIYTTITSMWEFSRYHINTLKAKNAAAAKKMTDFLSILHQHKLSLIDDWIKMTENDGYNEWRLNERKKLDENIQKRFHSLQNPPNCVEAKIISCSHPSDIKKCGWGCGIQKFADCFAMAYGLQRTLIYGAASFRYGRHEDTYEPMSKCTKINKKSTRFWPDESSRIVKVDARHAPYRHYPRSKYLAPAIPSDLAYRIERLFHNPTAYWMYHIKSFYRKQEKPDFQDLVNEAVEEISFTGPIVGLHIRTNDNVEIPDIDYKKYLMHVDEFFDQLKVTQKIDKRKIYVATDNMHVIKQLEKKYPHYELYYNEKAIKIAYNNVTRFSEKSLILLTADIELLLKCNFLVCSYSSEFGKTVAELMFSKTFDPSTKVVSVDNMYFIDTAKHNRFKIIYPYTHESGRRFIVNKTIELEHRFNKNGLVKEKHGKQLEFPSFVVERFQDIQKFKTNESIIRNKT